MANKSATQPVGCEGRRDKHEVPEEEQGSDVSDHCLVYVLLRAMGSDQVVVGPDHLLPPCTYRYHGFSVHRSEAVLQASQDH